MSDHLSAQRAPAPYYADEAVTIYHGDCREILPTLERADLVLTDPPYGIGQADWDKAVPLEWWEGVPAMLGATGAAYVFGNALTLSRFQIHWSERGTTWTSRIAWVYESGPRHQRAWTTKHEDCLFWRGRDHDLEVPTELSRWQDKRWGDDRYLGDVWAVPLVQGNDSTRAAHPTQKPLDLIKIPVRASSRPGDLILDPFMGSGTTLRAAKDLGRRAVGIELEERYCAMAARRCAQDVFDLGEAA